MFKFNVEKHKELVDLACSKNASRTIPNFEELAEEAFDFKELPEKVKSLMHRQAYESGHSSGYYEIINCYYDIVELVEVCYKNIKADV